MLYLHSAVVNIDKSFTRNRTEDIEETVKSVVLKRIADVEVNELEKYRIYEFEKKSVLSSKMFIKAWKRLPMVRFPEHYNLDLFNSRVDHYVTLYLDRLLGFIFGEHLVKEKRWKRKCRNNKEEELFIRIYEILNGAQK